MVQELTCLSFPQLQVQKVVPQSELEQPEACYDPDKFGGVQ